MLVMEQVGSINLLRSLYNQEFGELHRTNALGALLRPYNAFLSESAMASLMFFGSVRLTKDGVDRKYACLTNQHDETMSPLCIMTVWYYELEFGVLMNVPIEPHVHAEDFDTTEEVPLSNITEHRTVRSCPKEPRNLAALSIVRAASTRVVILLLTTPFWSSEFQSIERICLIPSFSKYA
ncbi:hypothetical protein Tco_0518914 [Tanacetum coccineum]